jgi:hypothetical protein
MNNYKLIRKSDLTIVCSYGSLVQKVFSGAWGNPESHFTLIVPTGIDPDCVKVIATNDYYELIVDEELLQNKQTKLLEELLIKVREQRLVLLSASDWTQLADCPLPPATIMAYKAYRQALRDLPATIDPEHQIWPTKP